MSYQPQPPSGGAPPPPQWTPAPPAAPQPAPASTSAPGGTRRKGLLFAGIGIAVGGIVAGAIIASSASSTKEETVQKFARAPVGCTTTLEFDKAATFTLFVETKGSATDVGGDCAGNGASYERTSADPPEVTMVLVDEDDNEVTLTESTAYSYDTGTYVGTAVQQVDITTPGTYRLTVNSPDTDFAVAIGGDPEADSSMLMNIALAVAVAGLIAGIVLIVLGLRKRPGPPGTDHAAAAPAAPGWQPQPPAPGYVPTVTATPAPPAYQPRPPGPPTAPPPPGPGWGAPQA